MGIRETLGNRILGKPKKSIWLDEQGNPKTVIRTGGAGGGGGIGTTERSARSLQAFWDYYNGDGTVFASINTTAWNVVMVGFNLVSEDEDARKYVQSAFDTMDVDGVLLDNTIYGLVFGDAFIEKVRAKGKRPLPDKKLSAALAKKPKKQSGYISRIKTVNPITMSINVDEYGQVENYQQEIQGTKLPPLDPADIMHFRFFPKPQSQYGMSIIEPSQDTIDRKITNDESLANAMIRHGTPKYKVIVGDKDNIPPDSVFTQIEAELEDITYEHEFIIPGTVDIQPLDQTGVVGVGEYSNYFQTLLVIGLLCPEEALGLGRGPLHPDTELFIKGKGFIKIPNIKVGDDILTLNPKNNELEFQPNKKTWIYPINEELYHFDGQTYDIMCTKDHRMYYRGQHKKDFDITLTEKLPTRFELQVGGFNWIGQDTEFIKVPEMSLYVGRNRSLVGIDGEKVIPMDIWLEFLGYFLSEGYTYIVDGITYDVGIRQFPGEKYNKIKECISKLPFHIHYDKDRFRIHSKQLAKYLEKFGKSNNKYIPEDLKNLSPNKLEILYNALMLGDGCENNYFTSSKQLANDVQEIILKMGFGSTIYIRDRIGQEVKINGKVTGKVNYLQYTITKNEYNLTPEICIKDTKGHSSILKKEKYDGNVYCVTVDNGLILTRLNGKCVITGNSTEATSKVKEIMYERYIKSMQHKIASVVRLTVINDILLEAGFEENTVFMRFNTVTDADEAVKAKWMGNLLRGFPVGAKPFTINEIRAIFDYPPLDEAELQAQIDQAAQVQTQAQPKSSNGDDEEKSDNTTKEKPKEEKKEALNDLQKVLLSLKMSLDDIREDVDNLKEERDVENST